MCFSPDLRRGEKRIEKGLQFWGVLRAEGEALARSQLAAAVRPDELELEDVGGCPHQAEGVARILRDLS